MIGDQKYDKKENQSCKVYSVAGEKEGTYVPVYITIGYVNGKGVNYVSLVFAPSYQN